MEAWLFVRGVYAGPIHGLMRGEGWAVQLGVYHHPALARADRWGGSLEVRFDLSGVQRCMGISRRASSPAPSCGALG
jgi:hypothetical protein